MKAARPFSNGGDGMEFRKKKWKEETLTLVDSRLQKWSYISAKDMRQQYPNGGYLILVDSKAGKKRMQSDI